MRSEDISVFYQQGFVKIEKAFSSDQARQMQDLIWNSIEEQFAVTRDDRASWQRARPPIKLQHLRGHEHFKSIGSDTVMDAFDHLLGKGQWKLPWHWGQFLIGFPSEQSFSIPDEIWHTDFGFERDQDPLEGLLVLSLISNVPPAAGGTMLIEGSHQFVKQFIQTMPNEQRKKMKTIRKALYDSHPWFRKLTDSRDETDRISFFMESVQKVDDNDLKVVQITGSAGDVIIAHPWLLHASSPNCADQVKMMRVHRIHRREAI